MRKSKRRSSSDGLGLVERYAASGLTQRAFAAAEGVTMSTFQYWLRKSRGGASEESEPGPIGFIEVRGEKAEASSGRVWMEMGKGMSLCFDSLPSPSYLAQVASAFGALSRC